HRHNRNHNHNLFLFRGLDFKFRTVQNRWSKADFGKSQTEGTYHMRKRTCWLWPFVPVMALALPILAAEHPSLPLVGNVELQPLGAQVKRLTETLEALGAPLAKSDLDALQAALRRA